MIFAITSIWQVAMIYIGIAFRYDCHIKDKIPIWLIVYGVLGITIFVLKIADSIVGLLRYILGFRAEYEKRIDLKKTLMFLDTKSIRVIRHH